MPIADYTSFSDCVKKNQDKDDPEAYCAEIKRKVEKMVDNDWHYDMPFEKIGDKGGHMYIAGYASNNGQDEDNQYMDMDALKAVFSDYMKNPVVRLLHNAAPQWKGAVGKVVEKYVDPDGTEWATSFGAKPYLVIKLSKSPKLEWLRGMIDEGLFNGLSIGGKIKDLTKDGTIIVKSWLETSIVDVPSAKGSFFQVLKSACIGDDCPYTKGEMSAEDKKKEREEKLKAEKENQGEEEKKPNPAVQKFIGAIDNFNGDNMSSNERGINGFCKVADGFLKGGPGSGQKGHKTVHEKQEANRKDMTKFVMMMKKKGLDRDDIRVLLEEMIEKL